MCRPCNRSRLDTEPCPNTVRVDLGAIRSISRHHRVSGPLGRHSEAALVMPMLRVAVPRRTRRLLFQAIDSQDRG